MVIPPTKPYAVFRGQGADPTEVVITDRAIRHRALPRQPGKAVAVAL
jgi:hypothetical protein